jgi:hypothetical protein
VRTIQLDSPITEYSELLGEKLFLLGEAVGGRTFLAISESGRVFIIMETVQLIAEKFDDALESLTKGLASLPL